MPDERVRIRERPVSIEHPGTPLRCATCDLRIPVPNGVLDRIFVYRYRDQYFCRPSCIEPWAAGQRSFDV